MTESSNLLQAKGIGRRAARSGDWLLRDVNVQLDAGQRWVITGPSGAGKTLLLRALAMLDPLDSGSLCWRGVRVRGRRVPTYRHHVMYLHQRPVLLPGTVADNLRQPFALTAHRTQHFTAGRIVGWLNQLGRDGNFLDKRQQDLSGGEGQIAALLRAMQLDPEILLLDEPTAALDAEAARGIERLVDLWYQDRPRQRTVVWVSHDSDQARRVADHTLCIRGGRIEEQE